MTNDELRKRIADFLFFKSPAFTKAKPPCYRSEFDPIAEGLLAALRGAGVVIGEQLTYETTTDEEFDELDGLIDGDPETYEGRMELFAQFGLALVRVVTNE